jgi:BON domain
MNTMIDKRMRMLAIGAFLGMVVARLLDPVAGKRRRAELRDRTGRMFRRRGRRAARLGRYAGSYTRGLAQRVKHVQAAPKDLDDITLANKIETKIFRPADVPKGQINVNVQNGLVQLRGEVPRSEMIRDLEAQVRRIHGVRDVENLLHGPGVQARMHS